MQGNQKVMSAKENELIDKLLSGKYDELRGKTLRITRLRVPGKEVCLAQVITPIDKSVYHNLALHIGVHEGEDHTGEAIGLIRFTPWESVIVAADVAVKNSDVQVAFMDRFCGSLIITGELSKVNESVKRTVEFFGELGFEVPELKLKGV